MIPSVSLVPGTLSSALGGERRQQQQESKMETESDGANRKRRVDLCAVCQAEMHSLDWIGRRQKMNRFLPIRPPSDDAA